MDLNNLNEAQKAVMPLIRALADSGLPIELYASTAEERAKGKENGSFAPDGTIRLDINAGDNGEGAVAYALAHEITHFAKAYSPEKFQALVDLLRQETKKRGESFGELVSARATGLSMEEQYKGLSQDKLMDLARSEVIAEMCETILSDTDAAARLSRKLKAQDNGLWDKIKDFFTGLVEKLKKAYAEMNPDSHIARSMKEAVTKNEAVLNAWADAVSEGVVNFNLQDGQKNDAQEGMRYSIRRITGDSGTDYGIGVYLDSTLLDGLNDDERTKIVKEYIKEIGGYSITAFDQSGNTHSIVIADSRKFINKSGKRVPANKDLMYRSDLEIKQEAIAHVDELIMASTFDRTEPAKHPHDWLDNNGLNDWDRWNVYIQEKNNSVWKATLRIANSTNGNKVLYDITPIVKVEGARNRPHNPPAPIVDQTPSAVKPQMNSSRTNQDSALRRLEKQNERLQEEMDYLRQLVKIQKSGKRSLAAVQTF